MEGVKLMKKISDFLSSNDGNGDGNGSGAGDGAGNGYGIGNSILCGGDNGFSGAFDGRVGGYGLGSASGNGTVEGIGIGTGASYGYGNTGITEINGMKVHLIDGIATILTAVHGNIAKGFILESELTMKPCFVVKENEIIAHGADLRKAMVALNDKIFDRVPLEDRIAQFIKEHPDKERRYPNRDLLSWHHKLTGHCEERNNAFTKGSNEVLDGRTSVTEFLALAQNAYGGFFVMQLAAEYERRQMT